MVFPPMVGIFSTISTLAPSSCAWIAAARPAPPLPTTTTSTLRVSFGSTPSSAASALLDFSIALETAFFTASLWLVAPVMASTCGVLAFRMRVRISSKLVTNSTSSLGPDASSMSAMRSVSRLTLITSSLASSCTFSVKVPGLNLDSPMLMSRIIASTSEKRHSGSGMLSASRWVLSINSSRLSPAAMRSVQSGYAMVARPTAIRS